MNQILNFYRQQSPLSNPGKYAFLYDDLPDAPEELTRAINNVIIHKYAADDRLQLSSEQRREKYLRTMQQRLEGIYAIDHRSLLAERSDKEQQIAYCRDFALFMISILRHKGIPARVRVGFENYFI